MTTKTVVVANHDMFHAQGAHSFVKLAKKYKSTIWLTTTSFKTNAKSILGVMNAGALSQVEVVISAEGVDEKEAVEALASFIKNEAY